MERTKCEMVTQAMPLHDDVELELRLSLGGSFKREEDPGRGPNGVVSHHHQELQAARDVHALWRQEAKRKRPEKQLLAKKKLNKEEDDGFDAVKNLSLSLSTRTTSSSGLCAGAAPFRVESGQGYRNSGGGFDLEQNWRYNTSSPAGSDHKSFSLDGRSTGGDTRSRSCHSVPVEQLRLNISNSNDSNVQSDVSATSNVTEGGKTVAPSSADSSSPTGPNGRPLKPQVVKRTTSAPSLPQMPCVSTTGNGPEGKTINGFLHRYTKSEVSIICVCHGTSFTPAEFIQHAGGTHVLHPLRHITVIPSAF